MEKKHIPSPDEIVASMETSELDKSIESVVQAIVKASREGRYSTCFNPYHHHLYDVVKERFLLEGYTFRPTGRVGGIWQDSEDICWGKAAAKKAMEREVRP